MKNLGDKVVIRADLQPFQNYNSVRTSLPMVVHAGKVATVVGKSELGDNYIYAVDVDNGVWSWTEDMFEPVEISVDYKIGAGTISADEIQSKPIVVPKPIEQKKEVVSVQRKFKTGDRVIVKKSNEVDNVDTRGKKKLIGAVGIIDTYGEVKSISHNGILYEHSVKFEDPELQRGNFADGVWLFANEELAPVSRVIVGDNSKIIINYPAIIYVAECEGKVFKGVAKVMEGDAWDEEKGIQIAKKKAEIKLLQYELRQLTK